MDKANKPLAVSKDRVKELQRLAAEADANEADAVEAKRRYERAALQGNTSVAQFSIALYNFTLEFAASPKLISEKLKELGHQVKSTSSVYNNIARLAFDHYEEGDAKRNRVHRYASLIEKAHRDGMNAGAFKKVVANGLAAAERKLLGTPTVNDPKARKKARDLASKLFNNYTYEITGVKLTDDVKDGAELQLLAEYINGKIVVYGLVPPSISNTDAILTKLIASTAKPKRQPYDLMRDMQKVIKLVAKPTDEHATATYKVTDGKVFFVVAASSGTAALCADTQLDIFKKTITLPVATWSRVLSTLLPMSKYITALEVTDQNELVVTTDEREIPDIGVWAEARRHSITIGKTSGATMLIPLANAKEHLSELNSRWETILSVPSSKIAETLEKSASKKYVTVEVASGSLKFTAAAKRIENTLQITKQSYRHLKAVSTKMKAWASELQFEKRKNELRVSAILNGDVAVSAYIGIE